MKWIKKKSIFKILLLLIILATAFFLVAGVSKLTNDKVEKLSTNKGTLDLSNWNPAQNTIRSIAIIKA